MGNIRPALTAVGGGDVEFLMVKGMWREEKGFRLNRERIDTYIFVHFLTAATLYVDDRIEEVEPGGCVIWRRGDKQKFTSEECELIHDWFHADDTCGNLMEKYGLQPMRVYYPPSSKEITDIITEIEIETVKKETMYKEISTAMAEKLFALLARSEHRKGTPIVGGKQKKEYIKVRSEIHASYMHNWSVAEMAELVNASESRFYYIYKEIFGVSPQKDLRDTRLQRARLLLTRDDCSVETAAELSGFANQYHFIRQFKQYFGKTPGKYKRDNR